MKIAIIGLGLIGGSFAKAIKKKTHHKVIGFDISQKTIKNAITKKAIDESGTDDMLKDCDLVIVCLHPQNAIDFIKNNAKKFKKGSLVIDTCGVKEEIIKAVSPYLQKENVNFLGTHPMAGREFSGFEYSLDTLFDGAHFIITPVENSCEEKLEFLKDFALKIGFGNIVISTPKEHDSVIAYTSQLAHIVSNAYIKSPSLKKERGFSAGSFLDLTRVAKLNANMWTSLFMMNKKPLLEEIDILISNLCKYKTALLDNDHDKMRSLLEEGATLKENHTLLHNKKTC